MAPSDLILLNDLLQDWHEQLCAWARTGELTRAAQEALRLDGEPQQLKQLVREWSEGDFRHLPPVVLLPGSAMPGATGAYAISTGTIYLNQDLLASTSRERAIAVLTEELGHHLDALLNTIDTPGDEGHALRRFIDGTNTAHNSYNDAGTITLGHRSISAEFSRNIVASELITIKDSTFDKDVRYPVEIYSYDNNLDLENYTKKVAFLTHGWLGAFNTDYYTSFEGPEIHRLAEELAPSHHVLLLNWSVASMNPNTAIPKGAASRIQPIAEWVKEVLSPVQTDVLLIGHSLGGIMVSEIARLLPGDQDIVTLDLAWPARDYDLNNNINGFQEISDLSMISRNSLALVVTDSADYGEAGDNPFASSSDISFVVDFDKDQLGDGKLERAGKAHGATQNVYKSFISYLDQNSLVYKWLLTQSHGDPLGIKFSYNFFDDEGNLTSQPDAKKNHEGVLRVRADSSNSAYPWQVTKLSSKDVELDFYSDGLVRYQGGDKIIDITERGRTISFSDKIASINGDFIVSIYGSTPQLYDNIKFTHAINIQGNLKPIIASTYTPNVGDEFTILKYESYRGEFSIADSDLTIGQGNNIRLAPVYSESEFKLRVVEDTDDSKYSINQSATGLTPLLLKEDADGGTKSNTEAFEWQIETDNGWKSVGLTKEYYIKQSDRDKSFRLLVNYIDGHGFRETVVTDSFLVKSSPSLDLSKVSRIPIQPASPGRTKHEWRNERDFAVITDNGIVVIGSLSSNSPQSFLYHPSWNAYPLEIYSNKYAFAVLYSDGSVNTWQLNRISRVPDYGGKLASDNDVYRPSGGRKINRIFSTEEAFAALLDDGSVFTWGDNDSGGESSGVDFNGPNDNLYIVEIFSTSFAFAALRNDGSVVTWGKSAYGGNSSNVDFDGPRDNLRVVDIFSTEGAFAALRNDGSVVSWGLAGYGGDSSGVDFNGPSNNLKVRDIFSGFSVFTALLSDGSLVDWGDYFVNAYFFGEPPKLIRASSLGPLQPINQVVSSNWRAFAALLDDGSVATWGEKGGGDATLMGGQQVDFDGPNNNLIVTRLFADGGDFAALRNDGSVVTWPSNTSSIDFNGPRDNLWVKDIFSSERGFAMLRSDGSVIKPLYGAYREDNIQAKEVFTSNEGFGVHLSDGSIVMRDSLPPPKEGYYLSASIVPSSPFSTNGGGIFDPLPHIDIYGGRYPLDLEELGYEGGLLILNDQVLEDGSEGIEFNFVRTGDIDKAITVPYAIGGSAQLGIDYSGFPLDPAKQFVSFAHGQEVVTVILKPIPDAFPEKDETITLALVPGSDYTVGTRGRPNRQITPNGILRPNVVTAVILNDDNVISPPPPPPPPPPPAPSNDGPAVFAIAGTPAVGNTLTASVSTADPDGNGSGGFSYTWQSSPDGTTWSPVGTNSPSYLVASADQGKQLRLVVTYTDAEEFPETVTTSIGSVPLLPTPPPPPAPAPSNDGPAVFAIAGTPAVGNTLTASVSTADPDGNGSGGFSYSWQSSPDGTTWSPVGTNSPSYLVASADQGKQLRLVVTYTDAEQFPETVTTAIGSVPLLPTPPPPPPPAPELPTFSISSSAANQAEGNIGSTPYAFTVLRTGDLSQQSNVSWQVLGSGSSPADAMDFAGGALPNGTLTFQPGEESLPITVNVLGDASLEPNEGFDVVLSSAVNARLASPGSSISSVIDNDDSPGATYSFSATPNPVYEGNLLAIGVNTTNVSPGTQLFWRFGGTGITASDFSDGLLSGDVSIGMDGRAGFIRRIVADAELDPDETLELRFFADSSYTQQIGSTTTITLKEPNVGVATDDNDILTGTPSADTISGIPTGSSLRGRGSLDHLTGNGSADTFVLGDALGVYYDDGTPGLGTADLAVITDLTPGDRIQLFGTQFDYRLFSGRHNQIRGVRIDALTGSPGGGPEAIGFVQGATLATLNLSDPTQFLYV